MFNIRFFLIEWAGFFNSFRKCHHSVVTFMSVKEIFYITLLDCLGRILLRMNFPISHVDKNMDDKKVASQLSFHFWHRRR